MAKGILRLTALTLCAAVFSPTHALAAETAPLLTRSAQALGADRIASLEYTAEGSYFQFGQAPAPELPWPKFEVDGYVATLDYTRGAVHAKYHRVQVQEPGRARPHSEQTVDQYFLGSETWNLTPAPTAVPANLQERTAELWASPQGFVKAARRQAAVLRPLPGGAAAVSFSLPGVGEYQGVIDAAGLVTRVRALLDSPVLGDTPMEFIYSNYRPFDGVQFPARIERRVANLPWYDLKVNAVRTNTATAFEVPPEIVKSRGVDPSLTLQLTELAPGVWSFGGSTHHSIVIEQGQGLVVVEAPLSEARSEAVLAQIREKFGAARKVRFVVNTHTHFDHASGLRTYVDEGVTVVTHARNARYFANAWRQPRTLNPDRLSASGRKPVFLTFTDKLLLPDAARPVEVHRIAGSGHNDAFAMVWLPAERILIEGDAWTPGAVNPQAPPHPLWLNLLENITRLGLDARLIVPLHGAPQTLEALRAAVQR